MSQPWNTTVDDYQRVLTQNIPLIDVRAPIEFTKGSLPGSVNLPLMNDEERHQVGLCYKQRGQQEALQLGHQLVSGEIRAARIRAWQEFINEHPDAFLYCARGGLRSQITQQWIHEATGRVVPRIEGGYKRVRNHILTLMHPDSLKSAPIMLGGRTGCGKTILLGHLPNSVDLEGLAHHRGSSFGCFIDPQPSQADFENRLAVELLEHALAGHETIVVENEGTHVGRCYLPNELSAFFRTCPLVMLEAPLEQRVMTIFDEYVVDGQEEHTARFGYEEGMESWLQTMQQAVNRIARKLGREKADKILRLQDQAHADQQKTGKADGHAAWIEVLLRDYYDPTYDYNLVKKKRPIAFSGNFDAVLDFLRSYEQPAASAIYAAQAC